MKSNELLARVDYLISQGKTIQEGAKTASYGSEFVSRPDYLQFRASALSFVDKLYGNQHPYFMTFNHNVKDQSTDSINNGLGLLSAIKYEIENGWLVTLRKLVTAEIFSDFLEMSAHLLDEGYKDAAAVMVGSTLEEHLRQLCDSYNVDKTILKGTDVVSKKSEILNADLKKADVYGILDQKQVTAWLGLRNSAAHGKYNEYTIEQVNGMYDGVLNFISRVQ